MGINKIRTLECVCSPNVFWTYLKKIRMCQNLHVKKLCAYNIYFSSQMDASVQTDPVCIIDKEEEKKTYPVNTVALKLDHAYSSKKPSQPQTCSTPRKRKRFSVEPLPALPLDGSGCDTSLEECLSPIEDLAISKEMSPDDLEHSDDFEEIYDPKDETYEQVHNNQFIFFLCSFIRKCVP